MFICTHEGDVYTLGATKNVHIQLSLKMYVCAFGKEAENVHFAAVLLLSTCTVSAFLFGRQEAALPIPDTLYL